ncbi:hypothetical protein [Pseudooceanicola sp.]|uniref:hypothetical protein n=1 Tax=Pseudooceanicola sp. TaxID=1914328 RepID=UPI0035C6EC81
MTLGTTQEAIRNAAVYTDEFVYHTPSEHRATLASETLFECEFNALQGAAQEALEAANLPSPYKVVQSGAKVTVTAGPISLTLAMSGSADACHDLEIEVTRLRESESLHPEAETAILAEVISILAERIGGDTVHWAEAGITIALPRFLAAFTPLRRRGGCQRVSPRRVRPGETCGTPITFAEPTPKPAPKMMAEETCDAFRDIFADDDSAETGKETRLASVSTWAATASVGALNPMVGVPLAAYTIVKGADLRVRTHAFALTATLSGVIGSTYGHLSFF